MYHLVLLFAAAALLSGGCRSANVNRHMKLLADMDNRIQTSFKTNQSKRFITITRRPPARIVHHAGRTLELTCEAIAAPAPSIHWFKNDAPVYEYDKESNEIIDTNPTSLARVSSRLLVTRAAPVAVYTCLVLAGARTARTSTTVYSTGGAEASERARLEPLAPRALVSYKVFVDIIGSGVALPCRVRGHPRPAVAWTDNTGAPVRDHPRMTVLRSGELVISSLQWSDMGEFTCRASNLFGNTEIKTFVYPARPNKADEPLRAPSTVT